MKTSIRQLATPRGVALIDFHGTLVRRSPPCPTLGEVCRSLGLSVSEEHSRQWVTEAADGITHRTASRSSDHYYRWEFSRFRRMLLASGIDNVATAHEVFTAFTEAKQASVPRIISSAISCLQDLGEAGLRVVVCSNWGWDLPELIEQMNLRHYLYAIVPSARVGARKPHPQIFDAALCAAKFHDRSRVTLIGDHPLADGVGGVMYGLRSVHLVTGNDPPVAVTMLAQTLSAIRLANDLKNATTQVINEFDLK